MEHIFAIDDIPEAKSKEFLAVRESQANGGRTRSIDLVILNLLHIMVCLANQMWVRPFLRDLLHLLFCHSSNNLGSGYSLGILENQKFSVLWVQ